MMRTCQLLVGLLLLAVGPALQGQNYEQKGDPLDSLLFLQGTWHGEGKGPYGAYEFETKVERRGRWLLLTSNVFVPKTDQLMFVSTQVYGYDDQGPVLHLFDTAGSFLFRGSASEKAAHFEWKDGERYKKLEVTLKDGNIYSRYDAFEPAMFEKPVVFEGTWLPGERRRSNPEEDSK